VAGVFGVRVLPYSCTTRCRLIGKQRRQEHLLPEGRHVIAYQQGQGTVALLRDQQVLATSRDEGVRVHIRISLRKNGVQQRSLCNIPGARWTGATFRTE
jgi:hypothetical protein